MPLAAGTQSSGRQLGDNGVPYPPPLNTVRRIPNPPVRHEPSTSSLSAPTPIFANQVVALAREAMKLALEENQTKAAEASGVSNELKPGVTIDLSHKQIQRFPEEVVDIIKTELERYSCSSSTFLLPNEANLLGLHCHTIRFPRFPLGSRSVLRYDT